MEDENLITANDIITISGECAVAGTADTATTWTDNAGCIRVYPNTISPPTEKSVWEDGTNWVATHQPKKEEKDMRFLYEVNVVDYKKEEILCTKKVIADDEGMAKALIMAEEGYGKKELRKYDFIIVKLGEVRKPKEVQKVKMVDEEE